MKYFKMKIIKNLTFIEHLYSSTFSQRSYEEGIIIFIYSWGTWGAEKSTKLPKSQDRKQ